MGDDGFRRAAAVGGDIVAITALTCIASVGSSAYIWRTKRGVLAATLFIAAVATMATYALLFVLDKFGPVPVG